MKSEENIYKKLSAPLPKEAIQRTKASETKKGYDTTGYGYQYAVNRFNEVLGLDKWGYEYVVVKETAGEFKSGTKNWEIAVEVKIWVLKSDNYRKAGGSHLASSYGDALKGALTNAFKKTAAFWGVGKEAYEGSIDDDNVARKEGTNDRTKIAPTGNPHPEIKVGSDNITDKQLEMIENGVIGSHLLTSFERFRLQRYFRKFKKSEASTTIDWWFKHERQKRGLLETKSIEALNEYFTQKTNDDKQLHPEDWEAFEEMQREERETLK